MADSLEDNLLLDQDSTKLVPVYDEEVIASGTQLQSDNDNSKKRKKTTKSDKSVQKTKKQKRSIYGRQFDNKDDFTSYISDVAKENLSSLDSQLFEEQIVQFVTPFDQSTRFSDLITRSTEKNNVKTIILCSGALRCIEVINQCKEQKLKTAKCFARHLKVDEQLNYISGSAVDVAVGTPNRVLQLLNKNAFDNVDRIIIDMNKDVKDRTILDLPECKRDLVLLLSSSCTRAFDSQRNLKIQWLNNDYEFGSK
ncbi:hypothetical protein MP228_009291 [Amoeboaphelidium protococcarum]|nr:hypothetical protein MP228_009291 [Amoeboaphelidium protococcarum]